MVHQRTLKQNAGLVAIVAIGLLLRFGWIGFQSSTEASIERFPDQRETLQLARNLLDGQGLQFTDAKFGDQVFASRMPGYPLFVAACGANVRVVRVAQALIDSSTIVAIYLMAGRWLRRRQALLAAAPVAVNPFLIYLTGLVLSESLFTAMLAWGMCLLVRAGGRGAGNASPRPALAMTAWLGGGLLLALSIHVRQSALPLPVLLGVVAVLVNRHRPAPYHRRWPLPVGTTMVLLSGLVLLPWAYRNYRVLGTWVWTTTNGGITAYDGLHPDATGASDQSFVEVMPELRRMDELGRNEHLRRLAMEAATDDPLRVAQLAARKALRTWSPVTLSEDYSSTKYWLVGLLYSVPFDLLVIAGLLSSPRRGGLGVSAKVFLLLPAIYFTGIHALTVGSVRYRIPLEPPMAVIAAASLGALLARRRPTSKWKRARGEDRKAVVNEAAEL